MRGVTISRDLKLVIVGMGLGVFVLNAVENLTSGGLDTVTGAVVLILVMHILFTGGLEDPRGEDR